jgi:Calcineurin-like phosphoesterase
MHKVTGDRDAVLSLLKNTVNQLGEDQPKSRKAGMLALGVSSGTKWMGERDNVIDTLKRGLKRAEAQESGKELVGNGAKALIPHERAVESWYAPRDRTIAVFQAAMDEFLDERKTRKPGKLGVAASGPAKRDFSEPGLGAFYANGTGPQKAKFKPGVLAAALEQFDNLDPRWIEVVWEKAKVLLKGKHKFVTHKSVTDFRFDLADNATIAVVGDWGGGNAAAQAVAEQIKAIRPDHVIHLGDVYYAGTPKEIQDRFLKYWPAPKSPGRSFALNSNHEMYSGGYGYFDVTLKQFKQPASYFSIANKNWRFIGLDTGYVDHDLNKEQVDWLKGQFKGKNPKTVFLSHHQLFSAYENTNSADLMSRVKPFVDADQIYGWIWGHEHLCVAYQEHMGIKARCLGNGCFPYNVPTNKPQIPVEWIDDRPQPDDKDYRGMHTFALLTITGPSINIKYIDQDGKPGFEETWT